MPIRYVGVKKLSESDQVKVDILSTKYYEKMFRDVKNANLVLYIKTDDTEGKQQRYTIKVRVEAPSVKFNADSSDWDLNTALHKVFKNIENEIKHKMRTDDKWK